MGTNLLGRLWDRTRMSKEERRFYEVLEESMQHPFFRELWASASPETTGHSIRLNVASPQDAEGDGNVMR